MLIVSPLNAVSPPMTPTDISPCPESRVNAWLPSTVPSVISPSFDAVATFVVITTVPSVSLSVIPPVTVTPAPAVFAVVISPSRVTPSAAVRVTNLISVSISPTAIVSVAEVPVATFALRVTLSAPVPLTPTNDIAPPRELTVKVPSVIFTFPVAKVMASLLLVKV